MTSVFLALLAGIAQSLQGALNKKLSATIPPRILLVPVFLTAGLILSTFTLIRGLPHLDRIFWTAGLPSALLNALGTIAFWEALRRSDLKRIFPLLSLTPLFSVLTGALIAGEMPTTQGFFGILLIVTGLFAANQKEDGILSAHDKKQHRIALALGSFHAFVLAVNVALDRVAILHSNPYFYSAFFLLTASVPFLIFALMRPLPETTRTALKNHKALILCTGILLSAGSLLTALALATMLASYVSATKRLGILFALVWGAVFFKEKITARILAGSALAVAGAIFIALS
ncbi:MAG: hypothetical protein A3J58_01820 [Candidatus Sungbacteria bacterium RIFCSPHIGHO2_02_FULL_52_23]|uniref:EamA domain-containing protein n=1 Tax=Candidatus Sungbacteria bacterium RIFCSPHIGHO2_02_FULL_52_23 TaxID=1802274 RepID=A0A1G2KWQ7_9BACT|nr:MAG: hypothetical protein A3J58_01820 [Candidatus Sungbacteria bacterium RIFCSPHIGHO2_02_FULL_52_23]